MTRNTKLGAPYADNTGKERFYIMCSPVDTASYKMFGFKWEDFVLLDTVGITVTKGGYDAEFADNAGYYLIYNKTDLENFIKQIYAGESSTQMARLCADIVITEEKINENSAANFTQGDNFIGVFDGNGYSISGMCIRGEMGLGIFNLLKGTVKNLTIKNSSFTDTSSMTYFGGCIADYVYTGGLIENCTLGSDVYVNGGHAGGFAGSLNGGKK
jgi:hypothetical protein